MHKTRHNMYKTLINTYTKLCIKIDTNSVQHIYQNIHKQFASNLTNIHNICRNIQLYTTNANIC